MLLTEPQRASTGEQNGGAHAHGGEPSADAVWILFGGLDRSLVQTGIVGRLLEAGKRPSLLITSGFALANAVLVAGARRTTFDRRWEHLRASRFLASAALGSLRLLGTLNGMFDDLVALLADVAQHRETGADGGPEILVATEEGFAELPLDSTTSTWRAAVKGSLRYTSESAPLVAGAIREGAGRRRGPIVVLGLERTMQSHPDVDAARRAAGADGVRVTFITATPRQKAGLLDYLLTGSGTPERLIRDGRTAAERWMSGVGGNGTGRSGQLPAGGLAGADGAALSEPDESVRLWTSDASDSSNCLK